MAKVLFDSDVLIDHLNGSAPIATTFTGSSYSSISRAELCSWEHVDERVFDRLVDHSKKSRWIAIAEEAGRIRRETNVRLPDALVAASAIISKLSLLTRYTRHYKNVERLRLQSE